MPELRLDQRSLEKLADEKPEMFTKQELRKINRQRRQPSGKSGQLKTNSVSTCDNSDQVESEKSSGSRLPLGRVVVIKGSERGITEFVKWRLRKNTK